jgi:NhaP-type Na+/H+ or K+/H+ antiporter/CBS domain-containing protein
VAPTYLDITLTVGIILAVGALAGAAASALRLPMVTGYIVAGLFLGHHGLDALRPDHVEALFVPVNDFAMALVLFVLGGQFRWERVGRRAAALLAAVTIESAFTITVVGVATWIAIGDGATALLLGVLAVEVAPATTLLVLREYRVAGPVTDRLTTITGLSNVLVVVLFEIALLLLSATQRGGAPPLQNVFAIVWDLCGALLFGIAAGQTLIVLQGRVGRGNFALPLLIVIFLTIGLCHWAAVPHMLAFLTAGAMVANRSRLFWPITASMERFAQPAYVAFFVLGGIHLDFTAFAGVGWSAVAFYVAARTFGKLVGTRLGVAVARLPPTVGDPAALGLLCQAGAAIALAGVAAQYDPQLGARLLSVIVGAVLVFELFGPILVRRVVVSAGEVPMGRLAPRRWRWTNLRRLVRWRRRRGPPPRLHVIDLLHGEPESVAAGDGVDDILRFARHSPFTHLPVVDDRGVLLGVIPLAELEANTYDPRIAQLVIAVDLIARGVAGSALRADALLAEAAAFFHGFAGNAAPVVDGPTGRFLGMVPRAEVLVLARQLLHDLRG